MMFTEILKPKIIYIFRQIGFLEFIRPTQQEELNVDASFALSHDVDFISACCIF